MRRLFNLIEIDQTVSFSGYRNEKINIACSGDPDAIPKLRVSLSQIIKELYERGFRRFITGGAIGFDMMAAQEIMRLRERKPDVQHIVAVPFRGQESRYLDQERRSYLDIISHADHVHYLSEEYHRSVYHDRNRYMLEQSTLLVCFYDGQSGGTKYTVERAQKMGLEVVNLFSVLSRTENPCL